MPKTDPTYQVSRDALMKHFARGLNYDDDLVAGIYSVKENSLQLGCKFNDLSHYQSLGNKKRDTLKNLTLQKNPHFLSNPHET